MQLHHYLGDDAFDRKLEFCESMTGMIGQIINNIWLSDESCFLLPGILERT